MTKPDDNILAARIEVIEYNARHGAADNFELQILELLRELRARRAADTTE